MWVVEFIRTHFLISMIPSVRAADDPPRWPDWIQNWLDWVQTWRDWVQTWFVWVQGWLREQLGPDLKALHDPIDKWLGQLPMTVAVASAVGLYVVALIWVWLLRRDFVFRGAPDRHWWRDLRIWATVVVLPYVAIYLFFGR